jgi:hypothetical protein
LRGRGISEKESAKTERAKRVREEGRANQKRKNFELRSIFGMIFLLKTPRKRKLRFKFLNKG